jgi:hypothetical protein
LRIVEPFNDAQINNLGAKSSDQEFLLFLNNDVLVSQSSWLRLMVDECRADEKVGAVGCKLFYSDGTVQHAGGGAGRGRRCAWCIRMKSCVRQRHIHG